MASSRNYRPRPIDVRKLMPIMRDLHLPQLFAAVSHHTGFKMRLSVWNNIGAAGLKEPLRVEGKSGCVAV